MTKTTAHRERARSIVWRVKSQSKRAWIATCTRWPTLSISLSVVARFAWIQITTTDENGQGAAIHTLPVIVLPTMNSAKNLIFNQLFIHIIDFLVVSHIDNPTFLTWKFCWWILLSILHRLSTVLHTVKLWFLTTRTQGKCALV